MEMMQDAMQQRSGYDANRDDDDQAAIERIEAGK
jgi:hypothetical protein